MKLKLFSILAVIATMAGAQSATISLGTGFGTNVGIVPLSSTGAVISTAYYVGVGVFASVPVITDAASLDTAVRTSFTEFGTGVTVAANGAIAGSFSLIPADASVFNSKELYIVVGNGTTKANSTEFAILRGTPAYAFPANTAAGGSTPLTLGSVTSFDPVSGAGTEAAVDPGVGRDTIKLVSAVTVPEPSAVALLGLIGLAGLRRKR